MKRNYEPIPLSTLHAPVSPPRKRPKPYPPEPSTSRLAAIEAGDVRVPNHLSICSAQLSAASRPTEPQVPRLQIPDWVDLYLRNQHPQGRHFVIHQHDHPIAGPHYDLRLQFSASSSVSWSIMYGLPGNPNSRRVNRNAIETRVHCLWNHLIETASSRTGSMIIWDTGEYEILPYQIESSVQETDDSQSEVSDVPPSPSAECAMSESEKLRLAFRNRKIRLRLHGTRLPSNYTIILRLDRTTDVRKSISRPQRRSTRRVARTRAQQHSTSSSGSSTQLSSDEEKNPLDAAQTRDSEAEAEADDIDHRIRTDNAYPGSTNSIGSIHQRRWFLTLDRDNSGFTHEPGPGPAGKWWVRKQDPDPDPRTGRCLGFDPFYVHGPERERSIVTGRLGCDVLRDEGVEGFVARRGWRPVLD
ncbi:hypothetical protein EYZ11_000808 [Aspergillus tanneri]|uniref:DNA ligase D 3'-phosphoesterase domain-containing protein n=1 Tax=Aspergillus tanneri TaxID=1220188 RepID=A0A4S3JWB3_9EURO|nr:uncharacterized protein ATNIH1004_004907 [Aspergillus tanneri]KAA8649016.1 hypothetical protein ATNIH1004_004907 [Aspergillus tanneri]THC99758.1 hypothetical protein EYZ11_000808 [Aspergillus tanneri]